MTAPVQPPVRGMTQQTGERIIFAFEVASVVATVGVFLSALLGRL